MAKPAIPTPTAATQYPGGSATSRCPLPVDHLNITIGSESTDAAENCHVVEDPGYLAGTDRSSLWARLSPTDRRQLLRSYDGGPFPYSSP